MKMISVAPPIRKAISHSSRWSSSLSIRFSFFSHRARRCVRFEGLGLEARFLVDGLDHRLADAAFVVAMDRNQRFFPRGFFICRQRQDLRLSRLAHGLDRIVVFLFRD